MLATEQTMDLESLNKALEGSGRTYFVARYPDLVAWYDQHIVMRPPKAKEADWLYHLRARYRLLSVPAPVAHELEAAAVIFSEGMG